MGAESGISWTDNTFNPWWGCTKISPGCDNCYAETFSKRVGLAVWGQGAPRREMGDAYWREPLKWNRLAEKAGIRTKVFCASMADVFEGRPDDQARRIRLWGLIRATPSLDWQILTKRPGAIVGLLRADAAALDASPAFSDEANTATWLSLWVNDGHPPANVWLGTTVEDQARANDRIWRLQGVPAVVHFLSVEPMLEPINLSPVKFNDALGDMPGIEWVIVGGESGPGARPFDIAWARDIVEQCKRAGVAVFVKQMGSRPTGDGWGATKQRAAHITRRDVVVLNDAKGGDMAEWPADIQVREFPVPQ